MTRVASGLLLLPWIVFWRESSRSGDVHDPTDPDAICGRGRWLRTQPSPGVLFSWSALVPARPGCLVREGSSAASPR